MLSSESLISQIRNELVQRNSLQMCLWNLLLMFLFKAQCLLQVTLKLQVLRNPCKKHIAARRLFIKQPLQVKLLKMN